MTEVDMEQARARTAFTCQQGEVWAQRKERELAGLTRGTVVIIDIVSGEYVTGTTFLTAHPLFEQRFGTSAMGYCLHVGEPTFIGGGIG
jgi:hypothetical protein